VLGLAGKLAVTAVTLPELIAAADTAR
jgi:hypothetical protein